MCQCEMCGCNMRMEYKMGGCEGVDVRVSWCRCEGVRV